jgi:hypothetical protein
MNAVRAPWSEASFLAYLGGITILVAALVFLSVESGEHGAAGFGLLLFPALGFGFDGFEEKHGPVWAAPVAFVVLGLVFIVIAQVLAWRRCGTIPAAELI